MRILIIIIITIVLFFSASIFMNIYIDNSSQQLLEYVDELEISLKDGDWESGKKNYDELKDEWDDIKRILQLFINHDGVDNIEVTLARLETYIDMEADVDALGEISVLRLFISDISEKMSFTMVNIF